MGFAVATLVDESWAREAAARIAAELPERGSVIVTGGTTAERIYPELAGANWSGVAIAFSDERCVPPDDPASNYGMVKRLLLEPAGSTGTVYRMQGEIEPARGAERYNLAMGDVIATGIDLAFLGMGADCHIAGMFPGSPMVNVTSKLCLDVDRPDGMKGLSLTPPALLAARKILLIVAGKAKAEAVRRALEGGESPRECPVRALAEHDDVTFLLDPPAAHLL